MKERKRGEKILLCAILLTVLFILIHSLLPREISAEESDGVADFLAVFFPPDTAFGAFIARHVRKIAHFLEYGFLGAETSALAFFFRPRHGRVFGESALFAFGVAFVDETVQIFSRRGPMISDVWLDVSGFATFFLLIFAFFRLIKSPMCRDTKDH